MNQNNNVSPKERLIKRMYNVIQGQAMIVREDTSLSTQDRLVQTDILLDLMRFLKDYDENVQVLNKHRREKQQRLSIDQMNQIEKEDMGYIDR